MAANGWEGAEVGTGTQLNRTDTLVGRSKSMADPDLGPTRARKHGCPWGDSKTIAEGLPEPGYVGLPRLTVKMAKLKAPTDWNFVGRKTNAYRQVGNAFPSRQR